MRVIPIYTVLINTSACLYNRNMTKEKRVNDRRQNQNFSFLFLFLPAKVQAPIDSLKIGQYQEVHYASASEENHGLHLQKWKFIGHLNKQKPAIIQLLKQLDSHLIDGQPVH